MAHIAAGLDFDSLVNTMQGVGNDIYNNSANFVKTKSDLETRSLENRTKALDLNEKEKTVKLLDSPVSLQGVWQAFGGDQYKTVESQSNYASRFSEVMNAFGMSPADPENADPKQGLIFKADGKQVTNRDLQQLSSRIGMYVLATHDPFPGVINTMAGVKKVMGAKSEGPTLSDDEIKEFSATKDKDKQKAFLAYTKIKKDYDRYSANPELLYQQQLPIIQQTLGFMKSIPGADTSALESKLNEIQGYMKKSTDQRIEQQDDVPITGGLAQASGLKPGTLMPAPQAGQLGTGYMGLNGDIIKSNASVHNADTAADAEKMASQRNSINGIYYNEIPQRIDDALKGLTDASGTIRVPDPKDPTKRKALSPQEATQLRDNMIQKERVTLLQDQYDRGMWDKLFPGSTPPAFIDKSPVDVRNNVKQQADQVLTLLKQLDQKVPLNKNYSQQVVRQIKNIAAGVRSGDPAQMNQARKDLLAVTAQVQQYLKEKRPSLPAQIQKGATRGF